MERVQRVIYTRDPLVNYRRRKLKSRSRRPGTGWRAFFRRTFLRYVYISLLLHETVKQ